MKQRFAVFDIDGTLVRWQLFHTIVEQLAKQGSIAIESYGTVTELLDKWKRRTRHDSFTLYEKAVLNAWYAVLTDITEQEYMTAVETVFEQHKDQVYRYTRDLIKELRRKNYYLIAISGSHQEIVDKIAEYYGFDYAAGSIYPTKNGKFTGEEIAPVYNKGKALQEIAREHNLAWDDCYAVGDSRSDAAMMELVTSPIAFNPDRNLLAIARQRHWNIVVERKNVSYELVYTKHGYLLAD